MPTALNVFFLSFSLSLETCLSSSCNHTLCPVSHMIFQASQNRYISFFTLSHLSPTQLILLQNSKDHTPSDQMHFFASFFFSLLGFVDIFMIIFLRGREREASLSQQAVHLSPSPRQKELRPVGLLTSGLVQPPAFSTIHRGLAWWESNQGNIKPAIDLD